MVKSLSSSVMWKVVHGLVAMALGVIANAAYAEQFVDPTRPPDTLGMAPSGNREISSAPVLQSVLISPQRRLAIINGKTLKQGDRFGNSKVVSIAETEVVLQNGKSMQTLKLFPDVQKRTALHAIDDKAGHRR